MNIFLLISEIFKFFSKNKIELSLKFDKDEISLISKFFYIFVI